MIRDRRDEDLDRLGEVLVELDAATGILEGSHPRDWLLAVDAERSWVFDQAPVSVAPTRNVVGHVQIYATPDAPDMLVIGRLFVKPVRHDYGIMRYLLTEAAKHVQRQGRVPMLDPATAAVVPPPLVTRLGLGSA